jgi:hypothetical protein
MSIPKNTVYSGDSSQDRVLFPELPKEGQDNQFELEVFSHFIGHLRQVPNSRVEIKILSSIHFTADILEASEALIAKTLVDMGLRAPRKAFPVSFLDFVDRAIMRQAWEYQSPCASICALKDHWNKIGEDRFSNGMGSHYALDHYGMYAHA